MQFPYPQLEIKGITNKKVLHAIRSLPREFFVPKNYQAFAYEDSPLPIACGQTISQPFIVAYMTEQLSLKPTDKVLEIGTGSGFQAAVLAQLAAEVYTTEIYSKFTQSSRKVLNRLGFKNIKYKIGDGKLGWPEMAPFDKIIITAVAWEIPTQLVEQLKVGGKMILPLEENNREQYLILLKKLANKTELKRLLAVRFVPLL